MSKVLRRAAAGLRGFQFHLLAGVGVAAALVVPTVALGQHSTRSASSVAASAPKCRSIYYDSSADATDIQGQRTGNLDLVQTTMGLNRPDTKLRVVMVIKNLSKKPPAPANDLDYQVYWTNPSGDKGPNAVDVAVNNSGSVTYSAGTTTVVNGNTNYAMTKTVTATGKFGSGPNGKIEIDVPLSQMGLKVGQVLGGPVAFTADGNSTIGLGSISDRDPLNGGGNTYKIDQKTCIDSFG